MTPQAGPPTLHISAVIRSRRATPFRDWLLSMIRRYAGRPAAGERARRVPKCALIGTPATIPPSMREPAMSTTSASEAQKMKKTAGAQLHGDSADEYGNFIQRPPTRAPVGDPETTGRPNGESLPESHEYGNLGGLAITLQGRRTASRVTVHSPRGSRAQQKNCDGDIRLLGNGRRVAA